MVTQAEIYKGLRNPVKGAKVAQARARESILQWFQSPNEGIEVMEKDWDNLIILDACRFDVFADLCDIDGDLSSVVTQGETTAKFIQRNFGGNSFYDTVYVCANAAVGNNIEHVDVYRFEGLWGDQGTVSGWDQYRNGIHPEIVVDKTLEVQEEYDNKRIISHFLQPHCPYIVKDGKQLPKESKYRSLEAAARGEVPREEITAVYRENVEYVLEYVEELVPQLSGKTVITADHGELLGDPLPGHWKYLHPRHPIGKKQLFHYGHWRNIRAGPLINVPWFEVDHNGERRNIESAGHSEGVEIDRQSIDEQLKMLGYK